MSNKLRFRSGQVELHKVRVDSGTVIEAGDLVWLDTNDAKPAKDFAWTTDLATTQGNYSVGNLLNRIDVTNITVGTHFRIGHKSLFTVAGCLPLGAGDAEHQAGARVVDLCRGRQGVEEGGAAGEDAECHQRGRDARSVHVGSPVVVITT